jgi:predicted ATPase
VAADRFAAALALWSGRAFDGVPAGPVVLAAAAGLEELRLTALADWADLELSLDGHDRVAATLGAAVAEDPTREGLTARLMLALYRAERVAEALDAYERLGEALRRQGLEPGEPVTELAGALARRDPTLVAPLAALPAPAGRFIGRRDELDALAADLGRCRLLTITGPGGCGKTRTAVELARELTAGHPDGTFFVELAGLTDPDAVAARVATTIGVRPQAGEAVADAVHGWLQGRRALLVLDNCEHLRASVAALAADLLARSAGLRLLSTAREPLGLPGETVRVLGGMALPAVGADPAAILRSDAVRLLCERGAAARGGFTLGGADVAVAAEVCRRLDGLPLAIELFAARLRALPLADLAGRLDRSLDVLSGRTGPERHRTMRAAIDWTYQLLGPDERAVLRRLSVFAGGFDLAAAERVVAEPAGPAPTGADGVLEPLTALVERSMVTAAHASDGGGPWYRLLETIQGYAADRLAVTDEAGAARARHAAAYRDLVERLPPMGGADHTVWVRRLDREHDNLRAALRWAVDGDPATALVIAAGLWWYWWVSGQMGEGRVWVDRALAAGSAAAPELRAGALRAAAALARNSGDYRTARERGAQCLAVYRATGDAAGVTAALNGLSITCNAEHDYPAALRYGYESLARAAEAGNRRGVAAALNNVAATLRCEGRLDEAAAMFTDALHRFRAIGDRRGEAAALTNLGIVARRRGDPVASLRWCLASLARYHELDLAEGKLDMVEAVACLWATAARPASALRMLLFAGAERRRLGAPLFTPDEIADREAAERSARAALTVAQQRDAARRAATLTLDAVVAALLAAHEGQAPAAEPAGPAAGVPTHNGGPQ